ncbi:MAG TPA: hypothetical protein VHO66_09950 [Ruminiclostridium sp.]|nr:hypothetical protein [Ruminiclostridium sp.]
MTSMKLDLTKAAIIGRTFEEYSEMFRLSDFAGKNEKILDAASGVSAFCAGAALYDLDAVACDPIYGLPVKDIKITAENDLDIVMGKMPQCSDNYIWERFKNVNALRETRKAALLTFLSDFKANPTRYICRQFPESGFDSGEFSITLSSHFLFMYDEILDYEFHRETVFEMLRITSKEVRIFPLVNLKGERSPFVHRIIKEVFNRGYGISIDKVNYKFVKNGGEMLRIMK